MLLLLYKFIHQSCSIGGGNDAYVLIKTPHQKFKTEVKKNAGKEATWNQTFRLGVTDKVEQLKLELWDSDMVADDLIGKIFSANAFRFVLMASRWYYYSLGRCFPIWTH
jgi:Ca2+-dependent lipid-binding protein